MEMPAMPPKIKSYDDARALLAKLEGRAAMWERNARDAKERAEEFERAAREIREGATSVVVGRTTYTLTSEGA
jgi:septal ring factor EnvC (AmiA/AmiB activator)